MWSGCGADVVWIMAITELKPTAIWGLFIELNQHRMDISVPSNIFFLCQMYKGQSNHEIT